MEEKKKLPKRQSPRLTNYDYGSTGVYFVTICMKDGKQILSEIVRTVRSVAEETDIFEVGEGLAPPEYSVRNPISELHKNSRQIFTVALNGEAISTKFRQRTCFSADLCYNGVG